MNRLAIAGMVVALLMSALISTAPSSSGQDASSSDPELREIEEFNHRFTAANLSMDNAKVMALWADDGVSLQPDSAPMVGKKTITRWLDEIVAQMPGYRVTKDEAEFHDIQVAGDWASEWGTTHQIVQPPGGKPAIETFGKILLVLHREPDGAWKIEKEMWNAGVRPK